MSCLKIKSGFCMLAVNLMFKKIPWNPQNKFLHGVHLGIQRGVSISISGDTATLIANLTRPGMLECNLDGQGFQSCKHCSGYNTTCWHIVFIKVTQELCSQDYQLGHILLNSDLPLLDLPHQQKHNLLISMWILQCQLHVSMN